VDLPVIADYQPGDVLVTVIEIFFFVIWIWLLIAIFSDLFRDHELSGWAKAAWVLFLLVIPYISILVYLIARGKGMRERAIKEQADAQKHFADYVRQTAGSGSSVDELAKLAELKDKGSISQEDYDKMKAKLVG
jgi:hypothetical protein